jgi:hypothetical protein
LLSSIQAAVHAINKRRLLQEQTSLNRVRRAVLLTRAQTTSAMQQDAEAAPIAQKGGAVPAAAKASSNSTTNGTTKATAAATPAAANNASQTAPAPGAYGGSGATAATAAGLAGKDVVRTQRYSISVVQKAADTLSSAAPAVSMRCSSATAWVFALSVVLMLVV